MAPTFGLGNPSASASASAFRVVDAVCRGRVRVVCDHACRGKGGHVATVGFGRRWPDRVRRQRRHLDRGQPRGKARLLVADDGGNDSRPLYSTAGKQLAFKLIDGGTVRLPFITITDNHGQPMESHPHPVDIPVSRPLGESFQHEDSDLDAAVRGLSSTTSGTATG